MKIRVILAVTVHRQKWRLHYGEDPLGDVPVYVRDWIGRDATRLAEMQIEAVLVGSSIEDCRHEDFLLVRTEFLVDADARVWNELYGVDVEASLPDYLSQVVARSHAMDVAVGTVMVCRQ